MKTTIENPCKIISELYEISIDDLSYVSYDPKVNEDYEYKIIRASKSDGTFIFHIQLMDKVLNPILNRMSYFKKNEPKDMSKIKYVIGDIVIETDIGMIDINGKVMHGQDETISLPVKTIIED